MTERQLLTAFTKEVKRVSGLFWYKIPDTRGGQKKPFDVFAIYRGRPICIEFKKEKGKPEDHQVEKLIEAHEAGAVCFIGQFVKTTLNPRTERNITFHYFNGQGIVKTRQLEYSNSGPFVKYPELELFFNWAIQL